MLTLMGGLPASGKTTILNGNEDLGIRISLEEIRELFGHDFYKPVEPFIVGTGKMMIRYLLSQGYDVVLDATSLTKNIRLDWINLAAEYDCPTDMVWVNTPLDVCLERNAKRKVPVPEEIIKKMAKMMEIPTEEEDFCEMEIIE